MKTSILSLALYAISSPVIFASAFTLTAENVTADSMTLVGKFDPFSVDTMALADPSGWLYFGFTFGTTPNSDSQTFGAWANISVAPSYYMFGGELEFDAARNEIYDSEGLVSEGVFTADFFGSNEIIATHTVTGLDPETEYFYRAAIFPYNPDEPIIYGDAVSSTDIAVIPESSNVPLILAALASSACGMIRRCRK
jgi:hypothetical protein